MCFSTSISKSLSNYMESDLVLELFRSWSDLKILLSNCSFTCCEKWYIPNSSTVSSTILNQQLTKKQGDVATTIANTACMDVISVPFWRLWIFFKQKNSWLKFCMVMLRNLCLFVLRLFDAHNAVAFFVHHYSNPTPIGIQRNGINFLNELHY